MPCCIPTNPCFKPCCQDCYPSKYKYTITGDGDLSSKRISNIPSPMYIYMKTSGGLWHFLNCLGSVIDIAKKSNRVIIIDCKNSTVFSCNFSKIFDIIDPIFKCDEKLINKCKNEFKPYLNIGDINLNTAGLDLTRASDRGSYLIKNMKLEPFTFKEYENKILTSLSKTKTIILFSGNSPGRYFIECINRIKINKDTRLVVEDLYKSLPEKYIGIHYRNTDYTSNFDNVCKSLQSIIDKNNCYNVFIATDTQYIIKEFEKQFPECKFYYNKKLNVDHLRNISNSSSLHYVPEKYFKENNMEKYLLHQYYIADIYCVINSIDYITTKGNNIKVIPVFRTNKELKKEFFRDNN